MPVKMRNVSNPAAFGIEWTDGDGSTFQLCNSRGTATLMLGIKHGDRWSTHPVVNPERFGMTAAPRNMREFLNIAEAFTSAD